MRLLHLVLTTCVLVASSCSTEEDIYVEVPFNDTLDVNITDIFEGDTLIDKQTNFQRQSRDEIPTPMGRWPEKTVVYAFANGHFREYQKRKILKAMKAVEKRTCVKFRPKKAKDKNYTIIRKGKYCLSNVGYIGRGKQTLMLSTDGCMQQSTILHELLHTLGFLHMHNHPHRNTYVRILWKNIQKGEKSNFKKNPAVLDFGVPYDVRSIMHYAPHEFSRNGRPTIVSRVKKVKITNNESLSEGDVAKIRRMYSC